MGGYIRVGLVLLVCWGLLRLYSAYRVQAAPVMQGVLIGERDYHDVQSGAELAARLRAQAETPVVVTFRDQRVVLTPEEVGFKIDVDRILEDAAAYLEGPFFLRSALRRLLGLPPEIRHVPIYYSIDRARATAWLQALDAEVRTPPHDYHLLPVDRDWLAAELGAETQLHEIGFLHLPYPDWTWRAGEPGYRIDVAASLETMADAFIEPGERNWKLAVVEEPGPAPALAQLERALDDFTSQFMGFASFYLQDLTTGEVASFDSQVAFSGMSTLKLLIVMAILRDLEGIVSNPDLGQWIDLALGQSNNSAANLLLEALGDGSVREGVRIFTQFAQRLGLENTYMLTGYDDIEVMTPLVTPANAQQEWNTRPEPNLQSTAGDMGRTLAGIYECTQGRGMFIETFPGEILPEECDAILFYLSHNDFSEMLWRGLPPTDSPIILHKHGFTDEHHADVALIWGPAGPYVVSLFLFRPVWLDWPVSNSTMYNVSRISWRFFEEVAARTERGTTAPPALSPPIGYVPQPGAQ